MSITSLLHKTTEIHIPMRSISGVDQELKSYLQAAKFQPGLALVPSDWQREVLEALYFLLPLVVVERGRTRKKQEAGSDSDTSLAPTPLAADEPICVKSFQFEKREAEYQVVGSVLSLILAEELFRPEELVFVRCIRAGRIARCDKLALLAAELQGIPVLHWIGKRAPRTRERLWETFKEIGFNPLRGDSLSDYKSATRSTFR